MDIKQMQLELITYVKSMKGATDHGSIEQAINKLSSECPEDVVNVLRAYYRMLLEKAEVPDETYMMGALNAYITDTYKLVYPAAINDKIEEMASHCPPAIAEEAGLVTPVQKAYRTMCIEKAMDVDKPEQGEAIQKSQMSKVHELLKQAAYQPSTVVTQTTSSFKTEVLSDLDTLYAEIRRYVAERYDVAESDQRVFDIMTDMETMVESWQVRDYGLNCGVLRAYYAMLREKAMGFPEWVHLRYLDRYQLPALDTAERRVHYYIRSKFKDTHDGKSIDEIIYVLSSECDMSLVQFRKLDTPLKRAYMKILTSESSRPKAFDIVDSAPSDLSEDERLIWDSIAKYIANKYDLSDRDSIYIHIQELAKACPHDIIEQKGWVSELWKAYEAVSIEVRSGVYLERKRYVDNDFMLTADENRELVAVLLDRNTLHENFAAYIMLRDHVRAPEYVNYQIRAMALLCPEATVLRKNLTDEESKAYAVMLVERRSVRR